jgi:hypothetical protein
MTAQNLLFFTDRSLWPGLIPVHGNFMLSLSPANCCPETSIGWSAIRGSAGLLTRGRSTCYHINLAVKSVAVFIVGFRSGDVKQQVTVPSQHTLRIGSTVTWMSARATNPPRTIKAAQLVIKYFFM